MKRDINRSLFESACGIYTAKQSKRDLQIAFSSGEGGPLAVDEEDTVCGGKGKGDKVLFCLFQ